MLWPRLLAVAVVGTMVCVPSHSLCRHVWVGYSVTLNSKEWTTARCVVKVARGVVRLCMVTPTAFVLLQESVAPVAASAAPVDAADLDVRSATRWHEHFVFKTGEFFGPAKVTVTVKGQVSRAALATPCPHVPR